MILELDCGNSLIKWRLLSGLTEGSIFKQGVVATIRQLLVDLENPSPYEVTRCRLVSVRSQAETEAITVALAEAFAPDVLVAQPARQLGGVTNGYEDFARLGLDRWLALVAAYRLAQGACLVFDLGTAVTVDLVTQEGQHLGGYITPGMQLLRNQLFGHTRQIRYEPPLRLEGGRSWSPGTNTRDAVEHGCLRMLESYAAAQISAGQELLGADLRIFATGGDAALIEGLPSVEVVGDLVFKGLAIACP